MIFLNGLHKDPGATLPPGVTPEDYLTTYLPQDFSTVSNVRILSYEDTDLSALNTGSVTAKAMRIAFSNSGTPTTGSFMVGTSQVGGGYFTAVEYLWGFYAPTAAWEADAPVLLESFFSIDYSQATIAGCKNVLAASWGAGSGSGGSGGSSGSDARDQQLKEWYAKQENEDIFMEKFTDYTLNRDRVYNPETDQVYTVDQNFYQVLRHPPGAVQAAEHGAADRHPVPEPRRARREPSHRTERVRREGRAPRVTERAASGAYERCPAIRDPLAADAAYASAACPSRGCRRRRALPFPGRSPSRPTSKAARY